MISCLQKFLENDVFSQRTIHHLKACCCLTYSLEPKGHVRLFPSSTFLRLDRNVSIVCKFLLRFHRPRRRDQNLPSSQRTSCLNVSTKAQPPCAKLWNAVLVFLKSRGKSAHFVSTKTESSFFDLSLVLCLKPGIHMTTVVLCRKYLCLVQ